MFRSLRYSFFSLLSCSVLSAQTVSIPPNATEHLGGDVCYFEETTFNLWNLRISNEVQIIKRPQSIVCHKFDTSGHEIAITRYVQRNADVGSICLNPDGTLDFTVNEISRATPDTRTLQTFDSNGRIVTKKTWSFNAPDSTLIVSDSCVYDSTGQICAIIIIRDSVPLPNTYKKLDRNGSYRVSFKDGTSESFRYDTDNNLVKYTDREGMTVKYFYDERHNVIRQTSDWEDGGVLNIVFDNHEYDEKGNWTRCNRKVKDPGEPPRSTKIIERTYQYR